MIFNNRGRLYGAAALLWAACLVLIPSLTFAEQSGTLSVSVSPETGRNGQSVTFTISLAGNAEEIEAFGFDMVFDPVVFTYVGVTKGPLVAAWYFVDAQTREDGSIRVGGFAGQQDPIAVSSSGVLVTVTALVAGSGYSEDFTADISLTAYTDGLDGMTPEPATCGFDYIADPEIALNHTVLNFGALTTGTTTGPQELLISNNGKGVLEWSITPGHSWLQVSASGGTGDGRVEVSVQPSGLAAGTHASTLTITAPGAWNSPATVPVYLRIKYSWQDAPPLGSFDTPANGAAVRGSVAVTGWALDDIGVSNVWIYRNPVSGESGTMIYIGKAVPVEGARPDVESLYPTYPENYQAGWGYMMLTNFLPGQGNGVYTLHAIAADLAGKTTLLGSKTISCDNANAVNPFGAIDTPAQGGAASGAAFINFGWALTPQPNSIPTSGATINVYVDGANLGHPVYNQYREDIAALFPGYANSNGAVGYFILDTTGYANGVHTIEWTAADNAANAGGIGSRYFRIQNTASGSAPTAAAGIQGGPISGRTIGPAADAPLLVSMGFASHAPSFALYPDETGRSSLELPAGERLELDFGGPVGRGYLEREGRLLPLPVGSTLDRTAGRFFWAPGPAFRGEHVLVFIWTTPRGTPARRAVRVIVAPREGHPPGRPPAGR